MHLLWLLTTSEHSFPLAPCKWKNLVHKLGPAMEHLGYMSVIHWHTVTRNPDIVNHQCSKLQVTYHEFFFNHLSQILNDIIAAGGPFPWQA